MSSKHYRAHWHHTVYNLLLLLCLIAIFFIDSAINRLLLPLLLVLYVAGNGFLHWRRGNLHRDTVLEYVLVSFMVFVLLWGAIL
jgi:hypothetical protein